MDFLRENNRISFTIDGVNAWETDYTTRVTEENDRVVTVYEFAGGLTVTNVAKKYSCGAYEWVNFLENTGTAPTGVISRLWDCDCSLPMEYEGPGKWEAYYPDASKATKVYAPTGSTWSMDEFYCDIDRIANNTRINHIYPGRVKTYCASGGRSSEANAPFFNIYKNGKGYIFAIGWTGQWCCEIGRGAERIELRSGIQDVNFRLLPGEKFRTSSAVILPYAGDFADGQNKWRRFIKAEISPLGNDGCGPLCASIWGGMKTASVLERIEKIKAEKLPFEYIWMDAGWYGEDTLPTPDEFEGDWPAHTGDWVVSPHIHPQGLTDVSKAIHDAGMKFILWFEPERVIETTPTAQAHPEWFLKIENTDNLLLNLGNEEAWEYCYGLLSGYIRRLHIDCYRQDFNFSPLPYWQKNDSTDRRGITEIKHINGLYRLWDALLAEFPRLLIDNCASGGRRIDIETLKRSIPLWRSDYQCSANFDTESTQCHNMTFNHWMPYSGTGSGRLYDEYRIRSSYAGALTTNFAFSQREAFAETEEKADFLRKYLAEYLKIRPYFSGDFYPLTNFSSSLDVWCAMQFDRPEKGDGVLQIFRRENSPYESAAFRLRGIDKNAVYLFEDADGGSFTVDGRTLTEKGFAVQHIEKRKAKIYFYEKTEQKDRR